MRNVRGLFFLLLLSALASCREKTADDFPVWGLDVSRHQQNVDWEKVVEHEKPWFVFIKATEGTLIVDPTYDQPGGRLCRLPGGQGRVRSPVCLPLFSKKLELILPVLDIEQHRFMTDPKRSVREAKAFCDEIRRYYGADPIIYCSTHFYETYLKKEFSPDRYTLWIADYRGCPRIKWRIWQHTDSHSLPGIRGKVDRNVFAGSEQEFKKLIL